MIHAYLKSKLIGGLLTKNLHGFPDGVNCHAVDILNKIHPTWSAIVAHHTRLLCSKSPNSKHLLESLSHPFSEIPIDIWTVRFAVSYLPGLINSSLDNVNESLLMYASKWNRVDIVTLLLSYEHLDVNMQDCDGWTALMFACFYGSVEVVKILIADPRVDVDIEDYDQFTAMSHASMGNRPEIVDILLAKDNNVNASFSASGGDDQYLKLFALILAGYDNQ